MGAAAPCARSRRILASRGRKNSSGTAVAELPRAPGSLSPPCHPSRDEPPLQDPPVRGHPSGRRHKVALSVRAAAGAAGAGTGRCCSLPRRGLRLPGAASP